MHSTSWPADLGRLIICVLALTVFSGCTMLVSQPQRPQPAAAPVSLDFSDPVLNQRKLTLFGSLTSEKAETIIRQLFYLSGKSSEPISIHVGTTSGDQSGGMAIANAMQTLETKVSVVVPGSCDAAGTLVVVAATGERTVFPETIIQVRGAESVRSKDSGELSGYAEFWNRHASLPADWEITNNRFRSEVTGRQALELGVVDRILIQE